MRCREYFPRRKMALAAAPTALHQTGLVAARKEGAVSGRSTATNELDQVRESTVLSCKAGGAVQRAYERASRFASLFTDQLHHRL